MALIQISSSFSSSPLFPEILPTTVGFFNFGISGQVFASSTTSTSFSTFIGGSTPQTDRVTGEFIGTGLTYFSPVSPLGVSSPIQIAGTVTDFTLSYRDLMFTNSSPGPIATQITEIKVSDLNLPAQNLNFANLTDIMLRVTFGDDMIYGSLLDDAISAGAGNDGVYGNDGNDRIFGDAGNDYLVGENGDDQLFGGDGNDWIVGGEGNDWLVGGVGYDTLIGGNGDDGFVYDAGDNLFGYSGGAGFDTIFFDAAGPLVNINLAAQGFEQAIGTRLETGTEAWASVTTIYNAGWQLVATEFLNDDGSKSIWRFDPGNQQGWREIRDYYTPAGKLDYEQIYNDDGSSTFLDFDLANTANWFSRTLRADANGSIISDTYVFDAAMAQRSAEVGSVAVAIKALPVDTLI